MANMAPVILIIHTRMNKVLKKGDIMTEKLNSLAFATSAAIVAGLSMLVLGIFGNIGVYQGAVEMMLSDKVVGSLSFQLR